MEQSYAVPVSIMPAEFATGIRYVGNKSFQFVEYNKEGQPSWGRIWSVKNPECERMIGKYLWRYFLPLLQKNDSRVISFILDRTIGWGKLSCKILKKHFYNGVGNVSNGCGIKNRGTLDIHIKNVQELGFITILDRNGYQIQFDNINKWVIERECGIMLPTPKNKSHQKSEKNVRFPYIDDDQKCTISVHHEEPNHDHEEPSINVTSFRNTNQVSPIEISKSEKPKLNMTEISSKVSAKRDDKLKKQLKSKKFSAYIQVWNDCLKETYKGQIPAFKATKKDFGMLKHFERLIELPKDTTMKDFLIFCVQKWDAINLQHFAWIGKHKEKEDRNPINFPEYPDLTFVLQFKKNFVKAYAKDSYGALRTDYWYERKLRQDGYSEAEIAAFVKQRRLDSDRDKKRELALQDREEGIKAREWASERNLERNMQMIRVQEDKFKNMVNKKLTEMPEELPQDLQDTAKEWMKTCAWYDYKTLCSFIYTYGKDEAHRIIFGG